MIKVDQNNFQNVLKQLRTRFNAGQAELELTIRDSELGVEGYVVVWNAGSLEEAPFGKGGTRITPNLSIEEIRMLAQKMALKNAASGLPIGGAKSGLIANPDSEGFETQYRRFAKLVSPILRERGGIFGGFGFDIGGRPEHPAWICDELSSLDCFTGKPLEMGGTDYDKEGLAGYGVVVALAARFEFLGEALSSSTLGVQGMGAMGAAVARFSRERGCVLSVISDPRLEGTWKLPAEHPKLAELFTYLDGMRLEEALAVLKSDSVFSGPSPLNEVLSSEVDILALCASQDLVYEGNAGDIVAALVLEGANKPCTDAAKVMLEERGVEIIPDIIANPGGIIAAYVELTSLVTAEENVSTRAKVDEAKRMIDLKIRENVIEISEISKNCDCSLSEAGEFLALQRIFAKE